jgi:photosystem II stability/assembly factor-like uncharacterized protein
MKKISMGFNTTGNSQTSGRTTNAVSLGKLRNTSGSLTRKFKYCNINSPDLTQTFNCVFDVPQKQPEYTSGNFQVVVGNNVFTTSKDFGVTWEQNPKFSSTNLNSVAISNNGKYILTGGADTPLFYSNDGGISFTEKFSGNYWYDIKMSKSGQYQTAIGPTNKIYVSNNYGETFTIIDTGGNPYMDTYENYLGMSYDGKYQTITITNSVYRSYDYGQTWNIIDLSGIVSNTLRGICISGNGQIQMAVDNIFNVYKSTDYGKTWSNIYKIPTTESGDSLFFISLSETGQYVLIPDNDQGYIWISNNYGSSFTNSLNIDNKSQTDFGVAGWYPCGVSNTGQYQTVCDYGINQNGYIYTSNDYGQNFYKRPSGGTYFWNGFAMN